MFGKQLTIHIKQTKKMNELSANELKHTHREKALIELLKNLK